MKLKTGLKGFGAFRAGAFAYASHPLYMNLISNYSPIKDFLLDEHPIENKLLLGGWLVANVLGTIISAYAVVDGLVDLKKGTFFYTSLKTWKKLTKSEERKKSLEKEINSQNAIMDITLSELFKE